MKPTNRIFLQSTLKLENKYSGKFLRIIKAYRKDFISDYKSRGKDYAVNRMQLTNLNPDIATVLNTLYKEGGLMGARLTASELKAQLKQKDITTVMLYKGFGRNEAWIEAVMEYLKVHLLRFVADISDTMREDILRILQKAVNTNLSINDVVKELQREDLPKARARVIARTEIVRAANVGHSVGAADTPYEVIKKWSAAKDHRVRHAHRDVNGHAVDELERFKVPLYDKEVLIGSVEMLYPGDATAPASLTINCRCRVIYSPKRDAKGNVIMRRAGNTATVIPMNAVPRYTPAQIAAQLKNRIVMTVD